MSGAMSEGAGPELRDALVVCSGERAPYNLIIVIICVECGAEECGANFHAVDALRSVSSPITRGLTGVRAAWNIPIPEI